jgi:hypothetical protein
MYSAFANDVTDLQSIFRFHPHTFLLEILYWPSLNWLYQLTTSVLMAGQFSFLNFIILYVFERIFVGISKRSHELLFVTECHIPTINAITTAVIQLFKTK